MAVESAPYPQSPELTGPATLLPLLLLLALSGGIFYLTGTHDLVSAGEARAAEIAREMTERGNYILPSLNHQVSAETLTKPPLFHWLLIATAAGFGWGNTAMHIPSALAALGSIVLVYLLGAQLFGRRAGLFAALVLASSIQFMNSAAVTRIDMLFTFLILAAFTAFSYTLSDPVRRRHAWLLYASLGLATLAKGPAGFFIPLAAILLYLATSGRPGMLRALIPGQGLLIFVAIALPWYVAVAITAPPDLVSQLFFGQITHWWGGGSSAMKTGKAFGYYIPYLLFGLFPWSFFVPGALVHAASALRRGRDHPVLLVLFWFLGGLLVFSLGGKKAARYILPMLPAGALLMGWYWNTLMQTSSRGHRLVHLLCAALVLIMTAATGAAFVWGFSHPEATLAALIKGRNAGDTAALTFTWEFLRTHAAVVLLLCGLITALGLASLLAFARRRIIAGTMLLALLVWTALVPYAIWIVPVKKQFESPRPAAQEIRRLLPPGAVLYGGGDAYQHALRWYLDYNVHIEPMGKLLQRVRREPGSWVLIMSRRELQQGVHTARPGIREWRVDYYTITLFPGGSAPGRHPR